MDSKALLKRIASGEVTDERYKILVIASHPDDEVIGTGNLFKKVKNISFIHTTDGAPVNYSYHSDNGPVSGDEYSNIRFNEFNRALQLAEITPSYHFKFGLKDQSLAYNMVDLTKKLIRALVFISPDFVFLNPFEGGHPDHDSTALAAHNAVSILKSEGFNISVIEYALYFNRDGMIRTGEFLKNSTQEHKIELNPEEQALKQSLYNCFYSQRETISCFHTRYELFRQAPLYNFLEIPQTEKTYYDFFNWGIDSRSWLVKAYNALREIKRIRLPRLENFVYEYS